MRRAGVIALLAVLVAGVAVWVIPWLVKERDVPAAVPSPRALREVEVVVVPPGGEACAPDVGLDELSERARVFIGTYGRPGPPFTLTVAGGGYQARARVRGGYADNLVHSVPIPKPSGEALVRVCLRNEGARRFALAASGDSTRSRSIAEVDGRPTPFSFWLSFGEASRNSLLARLPETVERMTAFRPGVVGPWLLWPLALLAFLGLPCALLYAWRRGLADEEALDAAEDPQDPPPASQPENAEPPMSGTATRGTA